MNYTFSVPYVRRISLKAFNGKAGLFLRSVGYFVLQPSNAKSNAVTMFSLPHSSNYARFLFSFVLCNSVCYISKT